MLFNIHEMKWDKDLLHLFGIPESMMPEVKPSSGVMAYTTTTIFAHEIPIAGVAGDQQAALFGQMCVQPGAVKNTYGTGCFLLMNTGDKPIISKNRLLSTIAWQIGDKVTYALEGSIFVGGSVVQWLRDGLCCIHSSSEVEKLAESVPDTEEVYFVPALTGLGAPYWDQYARGSISGISRGTTAAHIARAALEGIAYQTYDIVKAMERDCGLPIANLKVDGGASKATSSTRRCSGRKSQRPLPWARHISPDWPLATGRISMRSMPNGKLNVRSTPRPTKQRCATRLPDGTTP